MRRVARTVILVGLAIVGAAAALEADQSAAPANLAAQEPPAAVRVRSGLVWRAGQSRGFTLDELARTVAPILWFSPDEPLILDGKYAPSNLPGDSSASTVYYSILDVRHASASVCGNSPTCRWATTPASGEDDVTRFYAVVIRYYFYYQADIGFGGHRNDLESFEVEIHRATAAVTSRNETHDEQALWVRRLSGSAHGIGWYTNELILRSDQRDDRDILVREDDFIVLPPHVLVEEGKHASAPDRNADGVYSPGFDVNQYPKDAWGIRDTLAGRYLPGSSFSAHMAKRRLPESQHSVASGETAGKNEYVLVATRQSKACNGTEPVESLDANLRGFMKKLLFCAGPSDVSPSCEAGFVSTRPYGRCIELINLSYRVEGGSHQVAFAVGLARVPGIDGWLAARLTMALGGGVTDRGLQRNFVGVDALYMPSTSRMADWYAAVGVENWANDDVTRSRWRVAGEAGWKIRFPLPDDWRVPIPFVGVRTGVRVGSLQTLRTARLVLEVGLGAW